MPKKPITQRNPLSKERVLTAAVQMADEIGIDKLSMRKLAQALEVEAMSLYNHIANKDDLIDGMMNLVIAKFDVPVVTNPWKTEMRRRATSAHRVLLLHPWAALLMLSRVNIGSSILNWTNATVGCLHHAGFSYADADHAWNALDNHIYGFTLQKINSPVSTTEFASAAEHYLPLIPKETYPHIHAMASLIIDGAHSGINDFEFGLDLLLNGLESRLNEVS